MRIQYTSTQYSKVFNISFLHDYYVKNQSFDFQVIPTPATARILQNYSLIFKQKGADFFLMHSQNPSLQALLTGLKKEKLSFTLLCTNKYFNHFTELPLTKNANEIYHLSNESATTTTENSCQFQLNDSQLITLLPKTFEYQFEQPINNALIELKDEQEQVITSRKVAKESLRYYAVNLFHWPLGKYSLWLNNKMLQSFYTSATLSNQCFGMLDIHGETLFENNTLQPKNYQICFNARATYWRYYLVKRREQVLSEHKISYTKQEVAFSSPEEITLSNGKSAWIMTSIQPIALQERIEGIYQLKMKKKGKGQYLSVNLPIPSIQMIKPDRSSDSNKIYSDVYVYI